MDLIVLIIATALIVVAQGLVIVYTRPRPTGIMEYLWIAVPAVGIVLLLVLAFAEVVE